MAIIKTLKDFLTKATLYPITKTQAVYDDTVGRLDSYLQNTLGAEPIDDTNEESTDLIDADTLGGRYTAEDLDAMPKSTAIEDYANIEPPITDADRLGGKYTAKDIDTIKQDIIDIYVGDDGKLHKVQGGADSVLPFNSGFENYYPIKDGISLVTISGEKETAILVMTNAVETTISSITNGTYEHLASSSDAHTKVYKITKTDINTDTEISFSHTLTGGAVLM